MVKAVVTEIGQKALNEKESMVILFGETATEGLKEYSVIQKMLVPNIFHLKKGDKIKIDQEVYKINCVGTYANHNLNSISHVTLLFSAVPKEDKIANGLYLSPYRLPQFKVGTTIDYLSSGE